MKNTKILNMPIDGECQVNLKKKICVFLDQDVELLFYSNC